MSRFSSRLRKYSILCVTLLVLAVLPSSAQSTSPLTPDLRNKIDEIAHDVLKTTGVPSASLAVVKDGKIAYVQTYGDARLDPLTRSPAADALQHWLDQQAVHGCSDPDAGRGRQVVARRSRREVRFRVNPRKRSHDSRTTVAHLRVPGFLATRLRSTVDAATDYRRRHHGSLGAQAAGFRARHKVAVQQYELRDRRSDCGESFRGAACCSSSANVFSLRWV